MHIRSFVKLTALSLISALIAAAAALPRAADGKPNLSGIWQASSTAAADLQDHVARYNMLAGRSVVSEKTGREIPYQPWAVSKKAENLKARQKADPLEQCYLPGTPRIMYMDYPFQIFQTSRAVGIAFEWSLVHRLIYTDGSQHPADVDTWMGDSRGHWDGDTLVVDVSKYNDKTWFDMAGDSTATRSMSSSDTAWPIPTRFSTKPRLRIRRSSQNPGASALPSTGERTGTGCLSMFARLKWKRQMARLRVRSEPGIPETARRPRQW
jgi:hypothetical protein